MNRSKLKLVAACLFALLAVAGGSSFAQGNPAEETPPRETVWNAWGGEIQFVWMRELTRDYGLEVSPGRGVVGLGFDDGERLELRDATRLSLGLRDGAFDGFRGGSLSVRGGFDLQLGDGSIALRDFTLRPRADDRFVLDVVAGDGVAWFYIDRLMYKLEDRPARLSVLAMDLRVAPALAERLGRPAIAGHVVAAMRMVTHVHANDFSLPARVKGGPAGCGKWHGCAVPGRLAQYRADVFMEDFSTQYVRKSTDANGPGGTDGRVVFTPSSTLRNNRNNGTAIDTIPGDPLGRSTALYAANVPWYTKFTAPSDPHGNDQHPYLIWNLYRIDAEGRLTQVGRSGVKHAFLTINVGCDENPGDGHILGRGCSDTYGVGNNDSTSSLGPRNEILPATGQWGRCGSVYDKDCNGGIDSGAPCVGVTGCSTFFNRLAVRESKIDPAANAGASWLFESWYIVRDDINIFNTMQTAPISFAWASPAWSSTDGAPQLLGPAIDRWAAGTLPAGTQQTTASIARPEGQARVVGRAKDLGNGSWRYDYYVMNFDFAIPVTEGAEPNLRVLSNDGFTAMRVSLPQGVTPTAVVFDDGDGDTSNDWPAALADGVLRWSAPAGAELDWGTLFHFSFTAAAPPRSSELGLATAKAGPVPDESIVVAVGPDDDGLPRFRVGGSASRVLGTDGLELSMNGGEPLLISSDDPFDLPQLLRDGANYEVTIARQPSGRACSIANGSGTIAGQDVDDVAVDCVGYAVGGGAVGVNGTDGVELRLNGTETILRLQDGPLTFATPLALSETYEVVIVRAPSGKECSLTGAQGTIIGSDVASVFVQCVPNSATVGGTITGLAPQASMVMSLNGVGAYGFVANGAFTFENRVPIGDAYSVSIDVQPEGQQCILQNGSGVVPEQGVSNVAVICNDLPQDVRIALSGLADGQSVQLELNTGERLSLFSNGQHSFFGTLMPGTTYSVTVVLQPAQQTCDVSPATGTVGYAPVAVAVACGERRYRVDGALSGLRAGESVTLRLNGGETLVRDANGPFEFVTELGASTNYQVELVAVAGGLDCTMQAASGSMADAEAGDVAVGCVPLPSAMFRNGFEP